MESLSSPAHDDRNDDAALCDRGRLAEADLALPKSVRTSDRARDEALLQAAAEKERDSIDALEALGVRGTIDGMSGAPRGPQKYSGVGILASRVAAAEMSSEIARGMKPEDDAERSAAVMGRALLVASEALARMRDGATPDNELCDRYDLGAVADLVRAVDGPNGKKVAWAHLGDSRILHFVKATGELRVVTRDHTEATAAADADEISQAEAECVNFSADPMDYSRRLSRLGGGDQAKIAAAHKRMEPYVFSGNGLTKALGTRGGKPDTGTFSVMDGDVVLVASDGVNPLGIERIRNMLADGKGARDIVAAAYNRRHAMTEAISRPADGDPGPHAYDDVTVSELRF